jgi:hypothetical protein
MYLFVIFTLLWANSQAVITGDTVFTPTTINTQGTYTF